MTMKPIETHFDRYRFRSRLVETRPPRAMIVRENALVKDTAPEWDDLCYIGDDEEQEKQKCIELVVTKPTVPVDQSPIIRENIVRENSTVATAPVRRWGLVGEHEGADEKPLWADGWIDTRPNTSIRAMKGSIVIPQL